MNLAHFITLGIMGQMQSCSGYDILQEIEKRMLSLWTDIKPGSVYNALSGLEKEEMIKFVSAQKDGSRPTKRLYAITEKGHKQFSIYQEEAFLGLFPSYYGFNLALVCNYDKNSKDIKAYSEKAINKIDELIEKIDDYKYQLKKNILHDNIDEQSIEKFNKIIELYKNQVVLHLQSEKEWILKISENAEIFDCLQNNKVGDKNE
jgi:DNA-binding PadR family transcriptional regulator